MALYEITSEDEPLDFNMTMGTNMVERTLRNAKNLIMCRMGEVPYDRQRGLNPALFDRPYHEAAAALIPELDRCMLYEPDAEVVDGWLEINRNGDTIVHCVVDISFEDES